MKHMIANELKNLLAHRRLFFLLLGLIIFAVAVSIYISVTIKLSDLRVITHYTAFGATHFYRDTWVYLFTFVGFVIVSMLAAIGFSIKLLGHGREPLALLFAWLGVAAVGLVLATYIHLSELI